MVGRLYDTLSERIAVNRLFSQVAKFGRIFASQSAATRTHCPPCNGVTSRKSSCSPELAREIFRPRVVVAQNHAHIAVTGHLRQFVRFQ